MDDIIKAYRAIESAERTYREVLREGLRSGVQQVEIAKALNRTREMIRRDAMTDEQREELRRAEAERKRAARASQSSGALKSKSR